MTQYISIKDAADLSGKSVQTIRRMVKAKKLKYRKDRTPQGFNYLVDLDSLKSQCTISQSILQELGMTSSASNTVTSATNDETTTASKVTPVDLDLRNAPKAQTEQAIQDQPISSDTATPQQNTNLMPATQERSHQQIVSYEPVKEFTDTMQKLIEQHGKEKENLFRLIETFQNKVISLENKIKVESNSSKKWFKLW